MKRTRADSDPMSAMKKLPVDEGHEGIKITAKSEVDLTAQNSLQSPLLRLPAELREKIWGFAYGDQELHVIAVSKVYGMVFGQVRMPYPKLPGRVSKQYWAETSQLFVDTCIPTFDDAGPFRDFVKWDHPLVARISRVRINAVVPFWHSPFGLSWADALSSTPTFGNLQELTFEIGFSVDVSSDHFLKAPLDSVSIMSHPMWANFGLLDIVRYLQQHKLTRELTKCTLVFLNDDWLESKMDLP